MNIRTLLARALGWVDGPTEALGAPIRPSTVFLRDPDDLSRAGRKFTRDDNPTFLLPEALLTAMEGGCASLLFSSGMAAATALLSRLKAGDSVVVPERYYSGLRHWLDTHGARMGLVVIGCDYLDLPALEAVLAAKRPQLLWIETPSNPLWQLCDIEAISALAHRYGALVGCDNTVSTPILTKPLSKGVDVVLHSGSKYLNGHADVVAGALVFSEGQAALAAELESIRNDYGSVLGPFEAWLMLRGMRTLAIRMEAICGNALAIAQFLESHPKVRQVIYPGLPSHPQHALALRQMDGGFGGMLSFIVEGGEPAAVSVAGAVSTIRRAISFGGLETTIEQRRGMEGPNSTTPADLLRLSVGIEHIDDLIQDLAQALERI
jgi:cystathionine gamma-synthase